MTTAVHAPCPTMVCMCGSLVLASHHRSHMQNLVWENHIRHLVSVHLMLQSARLYDAPRNHVRASYSQQAPVLDAAFQDDSHIFLAGLDGIVKR